MQPGSHRLEIQSPERDFRGLMLSKQKAITGLDFQGITLQANSHCATGCCPGLPVDSNHLLLSTAISFSQKLQLFILNASKEQVPSSASLQQGEGDCGGFGIPSVHKFPGLLT